MSVRLQMTVPMRSALAAVCAHADNAKVVATLRQYDTSQCSDLPFLAAQRVSELFRLLPVARREPLVSVCGAGYVHELLKGSGIHLEPVAEKKRPARLDKHLRKVAARAEQEEHDGRVNKLANNSLSFAKDFEALNFVSFGVNMLALMITGFIVFW
jgi:hypothetical protein